MIPFFFLFEFDDGFIGFNKAQHPTNHPVLLVRIGLEPMYLNIEQLLAPLGQLDFSLELLVLANHSSPIEPTPTGEDAHSNERDYANAKGKANAVHIQRVFFHGKAKSPRGLSF